LTEWWTSLEFLGENFSPIQRSRTEMEKTFFESNPFESRAFIIEKKDGNKIGYIVHFYMLHPMEKMLEFGYAITPSERGKGYCTEAAKIMLDYLFLSKDVARIQATAHVKNAASEKVLEKVEFRKEGILRKSSFRRGEWTDTVIFSILREEWKEPRILTRQYPQK